ncbi:PH-like domain-containing protein [Lacisediminihabitans changchengi]|uniref:PH domain-containing protein n=1 Tax=Lacisediminihabitans changchengi TaxID=2787634 RepID=A0A934VXD3_9MICO|nr:hypothetical protein [Lacisediminihabitans changchengi]MBK4346787.1 hypothetical protein [Lacisediminihabitans changchengi]MBK4348090.1 hypothetical protein [Lacisediminihabitans changchengi]
MDRTTSTTIVVIVILLALVGMVLSWRARQRRHASLGVPDAVPANPGATLFSTESFYAATTLANEPLNRVAVRGLGFRGRATITVTTTGVILGIAGTPEAFIPSAALRAVERATFTIDRVVESGGLVVIAWTLHGTTSTDVDSFFRVTDPADLTPLIDAITGLIPAEATPGKAS